MISQSKRFNYRKIIKSSIIVLLYCHLLNQYGLIYPLDSISHFHLKGLLSYMIQMLAMGAIIKTGLDVIGAKVLEYIYLICRIIGYSIISLVNDKNDLDNLNIIAICYDDSNPFLYSSKTKSLLE